MASIGQSDRDWPISDLDWPIPKAAIIVDDYLYHEIMMNRLEKCGESPCVRAHCEHYDSHTLRVTRHACGDLLVIDLDDEHSKRETAATLPLPETARTGAQQRQAQRHQGALLAAFQHGIHHNNRG